MNTSRLLVLVAGVVVALGVGVVRVSAHAAYDHSTPARDEVLQAAPAKVDVYFKQEVLKQQGQYYVRVLDEQETQVSTPDDGTFDEDDRTHIFADLPAGLPNGRYIVRWSNVSFEDGDSGEGAFCFYLAVEPTAAQQAECAAFAEEEPTAATTSVSSPEASATPVVSETPQPSPTPTIAPSSDDDNGAPVGLIIGGIIAGVVVLAIAGGAAVIWLRRTLA